MGEDPSDERGVLAVGAVRPVVGDGCVEVEQTALDEQVRACRCSPLGGGEHDLDSTLVQTAAQVDDRLAVDVDTALGGVIAVRRDVVRERLGHTVEPGRNCPLHVG